MHFKSIKEEGAFPLRKKITALSTTSALGLNIRLNLHTESELKGKSILWGQQWQSF
jgi:hypothetical protein